MSTRTAGWLWVAGQFTALGVLLDRLPGLRLADSRGATPVGGVLRHPTALHVAWDAA